MARLTMSDREESRLLIGVDAPYSDSDSDDYEAERSSRPVPIRNVAARPYRDDEHEGVETTAKYYRAPQRSRHSGRQMKAVRKQATRIRTLFNIRTVTRIILFASITALMLLLTSRVFLSIRPFGWPTSITSMVCGVIWSAAIMLCICFACAAINLFLTTNHLPSMVLNIAIDAVLPIFLISAGVSLFEDRRRGWSYSGWDWCGGMGGTHDTCNIVRSLVVFMNEAAGVIAIAVAVIHIGLLLTRVITLSRPSYWGKPLLLPVWAAPKTGEYTFSFSVKVGRVDTAMSGGRSGLESPAVAPSLAEERPAAEV